MNVSSADEPGTSPVGTDRTVVDVATIVVAGLLFFSLNVNFTLGGDAAMYADYALLGKFNELTLHLGYYVILFVTQRTIGAALGIPIQELMVWINVVAGALVLGVSYLLARHFLGTRRDALLCATILAVSGRMLSNATMSEMYMVQTFLVLSSFYLFVRERHMLAGLVGGLALLVSPLSAFAYLYYPVLDYQRAGRIRWKVWIRLAAGMGLVYVPFLLAFGHELLWGRRGLLGINQFVAFYPLAILTDFPLFQFKSFTVLLVLLVPALFAVRSHWKFFVLTLAVAIPHCYIISKLISEDNVFILNTDFFFACWLVIGWRELAKTSAGRWIAPLPLVGHTLLLLWSGEIFRFDAHRAFAEDMRKTADTYVRGHDAVMVTNWSNAIVLTFYGRRSVVTTIEHDPLFRQMYIIPDSPVAAPDELNVSEIYVLDTWHAGPLSQLLRSRKRLEAQRKANTWVSVAERNLALQCELIDEASFRVYRCVRKPAVVETAE